MHRPDLLNALSTGWIEGALGVSRAAVANWRRGKFPERRREQLIEAVRDVLTDEEAAPPEWVKRLRVELLEAISAAGMTDQERAALRALDATAKPTSGAAADPPESSAPESVHS